MSLSLLAPLFLAGLLAVAIPIWVHLTHRERQEVTAFPSLMFLARIPFRTVKRQKIRNWWLFLLRTLAVILLALAFARPLFDVEGAIPAGLASARDVVLLWDRSFSMGYGSRWEESRDDARRALDDLGPEDRAAIVLFDETARIEASLGRNRELLLSAWAGAELGWGRTNYGSAFQVATQILSESDRPRKEVILTTDFQRSGWSPALGIKLPSDVNLSYEDVGGDEPANTSLTVALAERANAEVSRVSLNARITTQGPVPNSSRIFLELNGEEVQSKVVESEGDAPSTTMFDAIPVPSRLTTISVRTEGDALSADDRFNMVLHPEETISVLLVEQGSPRSSALFIERALAIGDRPEFDLRRLSVGRLRAGDFASLARGDVVVLNDVTVPGGATGQALMEFVERGGGLLIVLGSQVSGRSWGETAARLTGVQLSGVINRSGRGGSVSQVDYGHRALEKFQQPRSGDFSTAQFYRYWSLQPDSSVNTLVRLDDGNIGLAETVRRTGRIMVFSSDLSNFWNSLAVQAIFLPLLHEVVGHLSDYRQRRTWYRVGEVWSLADHLDDFGLEPSQVAGDWEFVVRSPTGERRTLSIQDLVRLEEPGFYEIEPLEPAEGRLVVLAVNPDLSESDLSRIDANELVSQVADAGEAQASASLSLVLTPEDKERRQRLWWYVLWVVVILLLVESVVSNRLSRRRVAKSKVEI